jgi:osmoprotectant transport system permease protein
MKRLLWLILLLPAICAGEPALNIGSKRFTESYILGEIIAKSVRDAGHAGVVHNRGLGNTGLLYAALRSGAIDLYPEYTGTIALELLKLPASSSLEDINRALGEHGLAAGVPLGFENSYAFAMLEKRAEALGINAVSQLALHPELKLGLSQEFLNRNDGWPALRLAYQLAPRYLSGLDHGLAYTALAAGQVDVIDVYTTDAQLRHHRLRVLTDDRGFFPVYRAVLLYRADVPHRFPDAWNAIETLRGRISNDQMVSLNARVELDKQPFAAAADEFLRLHGVGHTGADRSFVRLLFGEDFARLTAQHLLLVFVSLFASTAAGVPLGIWAARSPRAGRWILEATGFAQTIPSLALLVFLITLTGTIGLIPALVALFVYALLPIVRNTQSGLCDIPAPIQESARALGLSNWALLRQIELPLASRAILSGMRTSAVINVGTATIAAFIGAGGYGERIVAGLAVHDSAMLLAGALPAAGLALLTQWIFDAADRWLIPRGLQGPEGAGGVRHNPHAEE